MAKSIKKSRKGLRKVYLDYAASFEANPSSIHALGINVKKELEGARILAASTISARPSEIIFTSGGTESNNIAIQGVVWAFQGKFGKFLPHIITTNIEHPSVLETFRILQKRKLAEISIVPVEASGLVDPKKIKKEIKKNTVLVSVHYANNEIGTIQPIKEIAKEIRHWNKKNMERKVFERSGRGRDPENRGPEKTLPFHVFFHTDAVQAANYLDLNVEKLGVDLLSLSGSKLEGSGRVGMLYKKEFVPLFNIFGGGGQEGGFRPGTENVQAIVAFSKALKSAQDNREKETERLTKLRDYFFNKLIHSNVGADFGMVVNGDLKNRLPNNVNITIPNIPSDLLVIELSARGVMVSAKSACESGDGKASYVIEAIRKVQGKTLYNEKDGSLRFTLGRDTTKKDIDYAIKSLNKILQKLEKWYN